MYFSPTTIAEKSSSFLDEYSDLYMFLTGFIRFTRSQCSNITAGIDHWNQLKCICQAFISELKWENVHSCLSTLQRVTRVTHVFNSLWQGITIPRLFLALFFLSYTTDSSLSPIKKSSVLLKQLLPYEVLSNELFVFSFVSLHNFNSLFKTNS